MLGLIFYWSAPAGPFLCSYSSKHLPISQVSLQSSNLSSENWKWDGGGRKQLLVQPEGKIKAIILSSVGVAEQAKMAFCIHIEYCAAITDQLQRHSENRLFSMFRGEWQPRKEEGTKGCEAER